jgi:adenylate cyclase
MGSKPIDFFGKLNTLIYQFGQYALDTESFEFTSSGDVVAVEPQVFNVLEYLIANRDRIVSKDELIDAVWDGRAISDGALNSRMNSVRRAVGDDGKTQAVIKTIPRRGFRFVADINDGAAATKSSDASVSSFDKPSIAVLPFENLSDDREQEYFSDGITEDIITGLSRLRWLSVSCPAHTAFEHVTDAQFLGDISRFYGLTFIGERSAAGEPKGEMGVSAGASKGKSTAT